MYKTNKSYIMDKISAWKKSTLSILWKCIFPLGHSLECDNLPRSLFYVLFNTLTHFRRSNMSFTRLTGLDLNRRADKWNISLVI